MKNNFRFLRLTLLIVLSNLFVNALHAQQNALKITPIKPVFGKFSIQYERVIAPRTTLIAEHQLWNKNNKNSSGFAFFGIISSSSKETTIKGYRTSLMIRQYEKKALNGLFAEAGFYLGKHDIMVVEKSDTFNAWSLHTFDLDELGESSYKETKYDNVRVSGLKIGAGWQKNIGAFSLEISGGVSNTKIRRQTGKGAPPLKDIALYTRLGLGFNF